MANTRETMGEQACLDALVADTLTSFEDDGITKVGASRLEYKQALTEVKLPVCKSVEASGFAYCANLEVVDMLGTGTIDAGAFQNDAKLAHLLLRGSTKTTLSSANAFSSTPINLGNGAVYVPSELLATYKADSMWRGYFITTLDKYPLSSFDTITESWAELDAMTQAQIEAKYAVGDTKLIDFGTKGKVYAQIAGFGHDDLTGGSGKAKVTFVLKGTLETHRMNASNTAVGGWAATEMRSYLASDILPLMPSDLQAALKEVTKYSFGYTDSSTANADMESTDKLFLLSAAEVGFSSVNFETKAAMYDIFTSSSGGRVKYNQSGSTSEWLLRSAYSATGFTYVSVMGTAGGSNANYSHGVVFGFCI